MGFVSRVGIVTKEAAELLREKKRVVARETKASFDFIATSRKRVLTCSGCKMTDEIWSLSGLALALVKNEWDERHQHCDGYVKAVDR